MDQTYHCRLCGNPVQGFAMWCDACADDVDASDDRYQVVAVAEQICRGYHFEKRCFSCGMEFVGHRDEEDCPRCKYREERSRWR